MAESCRICRGDESDGPLVRPCKCSGSIQFVHEGCLSDWLDHRHGPEAPESERACELCGYVYRFEPVYSEDFDSNSANLKVYLYRLWKSFTRLRARGSLVLRAVVALVLASITSRISFAYVTKAGVTLSGFLKGPLKDIFHKRPFIFDLPPSRPFTPWLDFKFNNPTTAVCWSWLVNGSALLVITVFFSLTTWMIAIWTLQDPVLALECEEILNSGSELNNKADLQRDIDYVKDLIRDERVNAQARAHLLARLDNEFAEDPHWMPERERQNLEERHQAEVLREELALEDDLGMWGLVDDLLGGPLLPRLLGIVLALAFLNITLIGLLYGFPFTLGRSLVENTRTTLEALLAQHPDRVPVPQLPDTFETNLLTYGAGMWFLLVAFKSPYTLFYRFLKLSERGRASICTAKQIAAIEKVWVFVAVEAVLFPLFCGFLLHMAFLPVMTNTSVADALMDIKNNPRMYFVIQWAIGMSYMYTLCDFFKGCRSFLRPGVLYFVQDPSDPRNEPIRNFLSHSVSAHTRKISFSGLIYIFLIMAGVGSVTSLFKLSGVVPVLIAPLDLKSYPGWSILRYWSIIFAFRPLAKAFKKARDADQARAGAENIHARLFKHEFQRAARWLDLESFLFDSENRGQSGAGHYVRAPAMDNVVYPRGTKLFVPCTESGRPLNPATGDAREMTSYKVVWRPNYFWARVTALLFWIWAKSVVTVTALILTPLLVGRGFEYICMIKEPTHNDFFHYIVGVFFAGLFTALTERVCRLTLPEIVSIAPRVILSSIFRFHALQLGARLFAPQLKDLIQPSEEPLVNYGLYVYLDMVFGHSSDGNTYVAYSLAVLAILLPDYLALIIAGGYVVDRYAHQKHDLIEKWKMDALEDYYLVRESLLDYTE